MARRPVISTSALNLNAPNYLALLQSIQDLQGAESNFYEARKNELNSYLGQPSRSTNEVESAYDSLLGTQPWEYTNIFNSAGNSLDNTETSNEQDDDGNDADLIYVQLPSALSAYATNDNNTILYNPGIGFREVDLLYTNISFYTSRGETFSASDDDDNTLFDYQTGFEELPVAYQGNNNLSGRLAHMYRLIGNRYDSSVASKYNDYINQVNSYNNYVGGGPSNTYTGGTTDRPYDGYVRPASAFGYNRPGQLSIKMVEESRGYS